MRVIKYSTESCYGVGTGNRLCYSLTSCIFIQRLKSIDLEKKQEMSFVIMIKNRKWREGR